MLGKNNFNERLRQIENESKQDHFSIRKLTIGAASVLIGLTFAGLNSQTAKADTVSPDAQATEVSGKQTDSSATDTTKADQKAAPSATNTEAALNKTKKDSKSDLSSYKGLNSFLKDANSSDTASNTNTTNDNNTATSNGPQVSDPNTADVRDAQNFLTAMANSDYTTVNLLTDVDIPSGITDWKVPVIGGNVGLGQIGVKGNKVINGNGHTLKLNNNQLSGNIIQSGKLPSVTFNNITIEGTGSYMADLPIIDGYPWTTLGDFSNINLNNVHTSGITFGGGLDASLISSKVNISGTTTIDYNGNDKNSKNSTLFDGNVTIADGANVKINAANLIQVFNGEAMNDISNIIPDWNQIKSDGLWNAISNVRLGSRFAIGKNANVNVNLDSTVTRLCDSALLNIDVANGATFKMVDNAPAIASPILDATANWVFLTANSPKSIKIITTNPDLDRPQVTYVGTDISGNLGMSDAAKGRNWTFTAQNSNLIALTNYFNLGDPINDILSTILPQLNLTGFNTTLKDNYPTPVADIPTKGKASKAYAAMSTAKDFRDYASYLNGPLFNASSLPIVGGVAGDAINKLLGINTVPGLEIGTDLDDVLIKTGAGRFNVSANKQTVAKDETSIGSAANIISVVDSKTGEYATLNDLTNKKVVIGVAWMPGKAMASDGSIIDGGVVTRNDGHLDKTVGNTTANELGNAVAIVTYADGTKDFVPVQVQVNDDATGSNTDNGSTGSNGSTTSNGSNGSNGSTTSNGSNGSNGSTTSNGSNSSNSSTSSNGGGSSTNGNTPAPNPAPTNTSTGSNGSNTSNPSTGSDNSSQPAVQKKIQHDAYVYDANGSHTTNKYKAGTKVDTYGTKSINGRKYYSLGDSKYIIASNIDGTKRKLKRSAYVYKNNGKKRASKKALKKGKYVKTYGTAVKRHGKSFYIIGANKLVKKANFR
ncbi:SLAP domain-containing protein [Lactobacillus sp. ESL0785]|uniref:SLAP domain-containing protein n=1 Tax=Lactobacillus sp. ESL0785 TaxID=2983232 RepID=UPI0023F6CF17|nr:SLAP domain-containing protein [Lactobacillus sp. ESL0785]WEV70391.1 SLAP domain-containing protein [Lactobacillus sp. ESL0785]